jgi:hypothetical protein
VSFPRQAVFFSESYEILCQPETGKPFKGFFYPFVNCMPCNVVKWIIYVSTVAHHGPIYPIGKGIPRRPATWLLPLLPRDQKGSSCATEPAPWEAGTFSGPEATWITPFFILFEFSGISFFYPFFILLDFGVFLFILFLSFFYPFFILFWSFFYPPWFWCFFCLSFFYHLFILFLSS